MNRNISAVVFDWSGTTVDFGCCAPVIAVKEAFEAYGIGISTSVARGPMGRHKYDHVAELLNLEEIREQWRRLHGAPPDSTAIMKVYNEFNARLLDILPQFGQPIPGTVETVAALRAAKIHIGATTGFTRTMLNALAPSAAANGYAPDRCICADEVPAGRPTPWACFRLAEQFGVYPMDRLAKVGDTVVDVEEGRNAGMLTIAVAASGNEVGLSWEEFNALSEATREKAVAEARAKLQRAGADIVIDSIAELPSHLGLG